MSSRYFISGAQLRCIRSFVSDSFRCEEKNDILELIDGIINNQFLGNLDKKKNQRLMLLDIADYNMLTLMKGVFDEKPRGKRRIPIQ